MAREHWFDTLDKQLLLDMPRRGVLRTIAALVLVRSVTATNADAKTGGRRNNKGNRKKNGTGNRNRNGNGNGGSSGTGTSPEPNPPPPQSCSGGSCAQEWAGHDSEIAYCEFICRQCDGNDSREFCIVEGDPNDPSKIAVCCDAPAPHCCDGKCTNRQDDRNNCGFCGNTCAADEVCRTGGCVCEGPDCICQRCIGPGLECCPGPECIFVGGQDSNNCGGCGRTCPRGQRCFDGICGCGNGFKYCTAGQRCIREEYFCCGGPQSPIGYCFDQRDCCGSGDQAYCNTTHTCP